MSEFAELPEPPLTGVGCYELLVSVLFRSSVSTGKLTISGDGVVVHLNRIMELLVGARSLTHVGSTITAESTRSVNPMRQWVLIESADGYTAAIRTRASVERLREMVGMVGVDVVLGGPGLRDQATKLLERPRPPRKDL